MGDKIFRIITLAGSGCLLLLALTQPCYCTSGCMNSFMALLLGWAGMLVELGALYYWLWVLRCLTVLTGSAGLTYARGRKTRMTLVR